MEGLVWVRVGDAGEYVDFDDIELAVDYLNDLSVGQVTGWRDAGFETPNYWSQDYISIYYGGYDADHWHDLDDSDKEYVESNLEENYL